MAGITQKSCLALFPLWSLKKNYVFVFWGKGRAGDNQQKNTKKFKVLI